MTKYIILASIIFWTLILLEHISSFESVIFAFIAVLVTMMIVGYEERKRNDNDHD